LKKETAVQEIRKYIRSLDANEQARLQVYMRKMARRQAYIERKKRELKARAMTA